MRRAALVAGLLAVAVLAAGCGFRLEGAATLPEGVATVYVSVPDELSPFAIELRRGLERAGARRAGSAGEADAVIRVHDDRTGRRVLSVSARNTPQEYEIYYAIDYSIDRGGGEALPAQRLERVRNVSFDESRLLAKDREEEVLRGALARDLADLVLRRLDSL